MDLVFLSTSCVPCNIVITRLGPRYSVITATDFAPCYNQLWKDVYCSHCTRKTYVHPEAHSSFSSQCPGHNSGSNFSPLRSPQTLNALLMLVGVQLSSSEPGSPASPCSSTSCRGAFLTSPPFLYSEWLCKTCSTTLGAEKDAPFCRYWLLPLYLRRQPYASSQRKPCIQQLLDPSRIQSLLCIPHTLWDG